VNLNAFGEGLVTIVLAIIGLAIVATLVGQKAQTSAVAQAGAGGLAEDIGAAEAPVTGQNISITWPSIDSSNSFGS
jgi:hypothetical protein